MELLGMASAVGVRLDPTPLLFESDPTYVALFRAVTDSAMKSMQDLHRNQAIEVINQYADALKRSS